MTFLSANIADDHSRVTNLEFGCYVHDRQSAEDMMREVIKLARQYGFERDPEPTMAYSDGELMEALVSDSDRATDFLNEHTVGGVWGFDGERGGFYLDPDDDPDAEDD